MSPNVTFLAQTLPNALLLFLDRIGRAGGGGERRAGHKAIGRADNRAADTAERRIQRRAGLQMWSYSKNDGIWVGFKSI